MNTINNISHRFAAAFALTAAVAASAHAADFNQMPVKFDDLNLNSKAGATVLYQRIRAAATAVCEDVGNRDLSRAMRAQACIDHAVSQAVATVNAARLAAN